MQIDTSAFVGIAIALALIWFVYKLFFAPIVSKDCESFLTMPSDNVSQFGPWFGSPPPYPPLQSHRHFLKVAKKLGKVFRRRVFSKNVVVIADKEIGVKVLKDRENFRDRPYTGIAEYAPTGLLALPTNEVWSNHRKHLSPMFADKTMKLFCEEMMVPQTKVLCSQLEKYANENQHIDMHDQFARISLDVIGLVGFQTEFHAIVQKDNPYVRGCSEANASALILTVVPRWFFVTFLPSMFKAGWAGMKLFKDAVSRTMTKYKNNENQDNEKESIVLKQLLKAGLPENEVSDELLTALLAGHETTGNTMSWALMLLAQNPEAQMKLRKEIDDVFEEPDFDENHLWEYFKQDKFPYLKAVIYETLRLYPTVPVVPRINEHNARIGEWDIPAKTNIFVSLYAMHRLEDNYSDPDDFKPERFYGKSESDSFYPFGNGVRICLGRRFALMEAIVVLAMLNRHFEFILDPNQIIEEQGSITMTPKNGIHFSIKKRKI